MVSGTGRFVRYKKKFEIKKLNIGKSYEVLLGKISSEIFETEGSRDRESPLYY